MRKIIVSEFMTLDGVMEAPGGEPGHPHTGWVRDFMGPEQLRYKLDEVLEAESLLIGRITYESFAAAWPQRSQPSHGADPDLERVAEQRSEMQQFADKMNAMPKHVVSTTLQNPQWNNSHVIGSDVAGEIARLKQREGGPMLVIGSRLLVHTLMAHDLVDEYRIMIFPVLLGSGRRLFPETPDKTVLRLVDSRTFSTGVAVHSYYRASW
ncbi:dihydrofolate reductase family protein [Pseudogulbenkiania subflava]|uniref:Dihydrofolate reductase n=1 Tax=Pseudogulbenkiania subflava DSM 22618 TaxID=1123014 RepID=A0A1Y6BAT1_9NEIS|nr:dihydrofolate reductase family protein [Pseudogulbenkiania subflava]SME98234.1 Dihydrofolate reductase [Pseudogulbenkiania subflava DSM 22618]